MTVMLQMTGDSGLGLGLGLESGRERWFMSTQPHLRFLAHPQGHSYSHVHGHSYRHGHGFSYD